MNKQKCSKTKNGFISKISYIIFFLLIITISYLKGDNKRYRTYLNIRDKLLTEKINDPVFQLTYGSSNTVAGYMKTIQNEIIELEKNIVEYIEVSKDSIVDVTLPNEGYIKAKIVEKHSKTFILTIRYQLDAKTFVEEVYTDIDLDGFEVEYKDKYIKTVNDKINYLPSEHQILIISYRNLLVQLLCYLEKPNGELPEIQSRDTAIKYPYEIPEAGLINWKQIDTGLEFTLIDVLFQNKLVDRIAITRIDPNKYSLETYNDYDRFITKNGKRVAHYGRKTIEEWQNLLGSNVIINGSYYKTEPYGKALAQMLENGERKGETLYSTGGTLLFEPKNENDLIVKVVDHLNGKQNLENYNYLFGTNSYPALYDTEGNSRSKKSYYKWRATRTILGVDNDNKVLMGNTQEGFFALWRLGHFLQKIEHQLNLCGNGYVLNMDGGPPACIAVKNDDGSFEYVRYGYQEGNNSKEIHWNKENKSKWKIPTVVSAKRRK